MAGNSKKKVKERRAAPPVDRELEIPAEEVGEAVSEEKTKKKTLRQNREFWAPKRLAEKLKQIRLHRDITQVQMFHVIRPDSKNEVEDQHGHNVGIDDHIGRSMISAYERGLRVPSLIETFRYAEFARVPMEILIRDEADLPFD